MRQRRGPPLDKVQLGLLESFIHVAVGRRLEMATASVVKALLRQGLLGHCCAPPKEDWKLFYCSELVAEALQQMGVLKSSGVSSADFLPSSFCDHAPVDVPSSATLDSLLCAGHSYMPLRLLLTPRGHLRESLRARKRDLGSRRLPSVPRSALDERGATAKERAPPTSSERTIHPDPTLPPETPLQ